TMSIPAHSTPSTSQRERAQSLAFCQGAIVPHISSGRANLGSEAPVGGAMRAGRLDLCGCPGKVACGPAALPVAVSSRIVGLHVSSSRCLWDRPWRRHPGPAMLLVQLKVRPGAGAGADVPWYGDAG